MSKDTEQTPKQLPSIGRIVHYRCPAMGALPLIVTRVYSDSPYQMVDGVVFDAARPGGQFPVFGVTHGDGRGQWNWPPRV